VTDPEAEMELSLMSWNWRTHEATHVREGGRERGREGLSTPHSQPLQSAKRQALLLAEVAARPDSAPPGRALRAASSYQQVVMVAPPPSPLAGCFSLSLIPVYMVRWCGWLVGITIVVVGMDGLIMMMMEG